MYLNVDSQTNRKEFCTQDSDVSLRTLGDDYILTPEDGRKISLLHYDPNYSLIRRYIVSIALDNCLITRIEGNCEDPRGYDIGVLIQRLPYKDIDYYMLCEDYNNKFEILDIDKAQFLCEMETRKQITEGKPGNNDKAYFYLYRKDKTVWKSWYSSPSSIVWNADGNWKAKKGIREPDCEVFEDFEDIFVNTDLNVLTPTV